MGRVKFTNTDSSGAPVTRQMTVTIDGERHEIEIANTGTAQVSQAVEEYLLEDDAIAVEPYETDDSDNSDED